MIFHGIHAGDQADQDLIGANSPFASQPHAALRIGAEAIGINPVRYDHQVASRESMSDGAGAAGLGIGNDQIGEAREPRLQPIG